MTLHAVVRKPQRDVIGLFHLSEVAQVTRRALGREAGEVTAFVAADAIYTGMSTGKREVGCVRESRALPRTNGVTRRAVGVEAGCDVIW